MPSRRTGGGLDGRQLPSGLCLHRMQAAFESAARHEGGVTDFDFDLTVQLELIPRSMRGYQTVNLQ
jgi:hypothetical protein